MRRSAGLQVWLSRSEAEEWRFDEAARDELREILKSRARGAGRKFVAVFDSDGVQLAEIAA